METQWLAAFESGWAKEHEVQLIASVIIIFIYIIIRIVTRKLAKRYGRLTHKTDARVLQMRKVITILINITLLIVLAITWGVRGENFVLGMATVFTFLGVALFAQWSIISNLTAGIIIYFSAPFRLGDHITVVDKDMPIEAHIEDIKTIYTHLRTPSGELIVIPNNIFLQKIVSVKE